VRVLTLLLLFGAAAMYESVHLSSLADTDVWWHLRTGIWILQNHAVPHNGVFSRFSTRPWSDASWGYDVLIAAVFKLLGLRAIPLLLMVLKVALAVSAFLLARGWGRNFWLAVSLAIAVQCALLALRPLPNLCSLVYFAIELALLFENRRTGNTRLLFWLPLLFVLWANMHVQFVYGLIVLLMFLTAGLAGEVCHRSGVGWFDDVPALRLGVNGVVVAVCFCATLVSPYTYHLYQAVIENASAVAYIAEHHAMNFRHPQHYVLLLLAMAAFLSLGRRRSRDLFQITLMVASAIVGFRMEGDAGFLALASVAVIADALSGAEIETQPGRRAHLGRLEVVATAVLLLVAGVLSVSRIPSSREELLNTVAKSFPVRASDYIHENHLPNPLFNEYKWGGFLTWYLPDYPVAIDGRRDLYGDEINERYFALTNAEVPLSTDPVFLSAQTILLPASSPMAEALATFPDFKVLYRDDLAMVLVRQN
jgi:hypothetical protein